MSNEILEAMSPEQRAHFDFYQDPDYIQDGPPYKEGTMERAKYVNALFKLEQETKR